MMAPHDDQGFESMLAQLDARGCRVTRAERQSSASHPRQPLVNAEEVGASSHGDKPHFTVRTCERRVFRNE